MPQTPPVRGSVPRILQRGETVLVPGASVAETLRPLPTERRIGNRRKDHSLVGLMAVLRSVGATKVGTGPRPTRSARSDSTFQNVESGGTRFDVLDGASYEK